jgi:tripartite-type tricarboxylate transporter receptor subunit TctC
MRKSILIAILCAFLVQVNAAAPRAQSPSEFFRGKTISMIIPIGPGGAYDVYGRLVAQYLAKYVPGNPSIVVQNMPGAGGVVASNYLYNVAPQDGTVLTIMTSSFATQQVLEDPTIKYDARKIPAIGRLLDTTSVNFFWYTSPIQSFDDLRTKSATMAASSLTEVPSTRIRAMNRYLGTHMKLISGYPSARDYVLAVQRGEADGGSSTFVGLSQLFRSDILAKRLNILVQFSLTRDSLMPDVPTVLELTDNPEARQVFEFLAGNDEIGRGLFTTPNVPADRLAILRHAFDQLITDPEFVAAAARQKLPLDTKTGNELQEIVQRAFEISPSALAKVVELSTPQSE